MQDSSTILSSMCWLAAITKKPLKKASSSLKSKSSNPFQSHCKKSKATSGAPMCTRRNTTLLFRRVRSDPATTLISQTWDKTQPSRTPETKTTNHDYSYSKAKQSSSKSTRSKRKKSQPSSTDSHLRSARKNIARYPLKTGTSDF
jgi:hypothetical protein